MDWRVWAVHHNSMLFTQKYILTVFIEVYSLLSVHKIATLVIITPRLNDRLSFHTSVLGEHAKDHHPRTYIAILGPLNCYSPFHSWTVWRWQYFCSWCWLNKLPFNLLSSENSSYCSGIQQHFKEVCYGDQIPLIPRDTHTGLLRLIILDVDTSHA